MIYPKRNFSVAGILLRKENGNAGFQIQACGLDQKGTTKKWSWLRIRLVIISVLILFSAF